MSLPQRKPHWLRVRLPSGESQKRYKLVEDRFDALGLNTVCKEARCPNIFECWGQGTATLMILGDTCTRGCRFCSVNSGNPGGKVDAQEPLHTAQALAQMDLAYVVLTMVDRDDLPDGGAAHVAETVRRIKDHCPDLLVETLVGDFQGKRQGVEHVAQEGRPDVYAHNVEVVPRLQRSIRDARCSWEQSLETLRWAREAGVGVTKTSLMVGLGETTEEVLGAMSLLREADVDVLTIGQYLRPTPKHAPVVRYVEPDEFEAYRARGLALGFRFVAAGPLVRSSYRAAEAFIHGIVRRPNETDPSIVSDRYGRKQRLKVVD